MCIQPGSVAWLRSLALTNLYKFAFTLGKNGISTVKRYFCLYVDKTRHLSYWMRLKNPLLGMALWRRKRNFQVL